ncbi:helix-turn-helix domain containing protein [Streptomyces sp. ID05-26A]|nr:helix-turn-helix domain containing protein [Streptomyces sp. ID05-26A]
MPKPTKAQIDAEILDRSAALFARHGFANTSLQQIADAVGYTKAGLLHHFPNKDALYRAVVQSCRDQVAALTGAVEEVPLGSERDLAVVEGLVDLAFAFPGVSAFASTLVDSGDVDQELAEIGLSLVISLGIDPANVDDERMVRVISAMAGLTAAATQAVRIDHTRQWRSHIVAAALDTLAPAASGSDGRL